MSCFSDPCLSFYSQVSTSLKRASQCLKAGNTRAGSSHADAASGFQKLLSMTTLPSSPEQSCTADMKKQLSNVFLPFLQRQGIEMTGLTFPKAMNMSDSSWVPLSCLSPATLTLLLRNKGQPFSNRDTQVSREGLHWCQNESSYSRCKGKDYTHLFKQQHVIAGSNDNLCMTVLEFIISIVSSIL